MKERILIFGNSSSGKSTLSKSLSQNFNLSHLDLDTVAWKDTTPPERRDLKDSLKEIKRFTRDNEFWVIEGCYSDLIEATFLEATRAIYMDLKEELCVKNAIHRPWEFHKYKSKAEQDKNLNMLINWIRNYYIRQGPISKKEHDRIYEVFPKRKHRLTDNTYSIKDLIN